MIHDQAFHRAINYFYFLFLQIHRNAELLHSETGERCKTAVDTVADVNQFADELNPGGNISQNFSEIIFDFLIFQFSEKFWEIFL